MKITFRLYDNGGKTADRYTAVAVGARWSHVPNIWQGFAFDENPYHPQGFGQHVGAMDGPHLGELIEPDALPIRARQAYDQFLREYDNA